MAKRRRALPTPLASNSTTPGNTTTQSSRRRTEHPRDPPAGPGYAAAVSNGSPLTPKQINARPHLENAETAGQLNGGYHSRSLLAFTGGIMQSTIPAWIQTCVMVGLIFGGCCSNVSLSAQSRANERGEIREGGCHLAVFGLTAWMDRFLL